MGIPHSYIASTNLNVLDCNCNISWKILLNYSHKCNMSSMEEPIGMEIGPPLDLDFQLIWEPQQLHRPLGSPGTASLCGPIVCWDSRIFVWGHLEWSGDTHDWWLTLRTWVSQGGGTPLRLRGSRVTRANLHLLPMIMWGSLTTLWG